MSSKRHNLFVAIAASAFALPNWGCSVPWSLPFARQDALTTPAATTSAGPPSNNPPLRSNRPAQAAMTPPPIDASAAPDLSGVLDKLQEIRQIDPTAEQKLIAELRKSPPDEWPLVAEQFRASLAYREQLKSMPRPGQQQAAAETSRVRAAARTEENSHAALLANTRPSAPIGALVDPRSAKSDGISSEALARSTPYSTPAREAANVPSARDYAAPAEFASDGPAYPINAPPSATDPPLGQRPAVVQARYDVASTAAGSQLVSGENDWRALIKEATEDLSRSTATSPTTTAEVHQHAILRILYLLSGDTEKALEPIPHISPTEQDYWSRQLFALATYLDHHSQPDDNRRAAASVIHLDQAVSSLRELGSLSVRNLSFCKNVYGYGSIDPYDKDAFLPGQQVSMYVEVENYHSTSTEKGYRTSLGSTYEILAEDGTRVGGGEIPDVEDYCRSCRRDFHIQYGLTLPEKIAPGKYQLQLVIKDRQSDKIGHATTAFEIRGVAPTRAAEVLGAP